MQEAELAVLREIYADWSEGNFRRTDYLHPGYELVFARDFLEAGQFQGAADIKRGWRSWLDQWASWRVVPLEYLDAGDRIAVKILVEGVSKATGVGLSQESGNAFEFREGLPCRITLYTRWQTMFEDLGLGSP